MMFLIVLAVLYVLDAATTLYALRHGATELNPVLAPFIERVGPRTTLLVFKGVGFYLAYRYAGSMSLTAQAVTLAVYFVVVAWNLTQISRARAAQS